MYVTVRDNATVSSVGEVKVKEGVCGTGPALDPIVGIKLNEKRSSDFY